MSFQKKLEDKLSDLEHAVRTFPWSDKTAYANFLAQTFYYVRHSTALLGKAARKLGPEHAALKERFLAHTKEETGHHHLAMEDLTALGLSLEDFPEFAETAKFYKNQYEYIDKTDSTSLFGYILQLEMLAARQGRFIYAQTKKAFGEKSSNFIRVHSADDVEHVKQAVNQVMKFTAAQQAVIYENFLKSCGIYRAILEKARSNTAVSKKAAA